MVVAVRKTLTFQGSYCMLVVVLILILVSSPVPLEEPTCSSSIIATHDNKKALCPSKMEGNCFHLDQNHKDIHRTAWLDRTSSDVKRGDEISLSHMPTLDLVG